MNNLSLKELTLYAKKILEDYDEKNPGTIFINKIKISNEDALLIQSNVAKLREKRGEKIIGYKIGCVSKNTQKKMGLIEPAWGNLWDSELHSNETILNKRSSFTAQASTTDIDKMVQAQSECLTKLGQEIASSLKPLLK
jgi:hypothetical protein